MLTCLLIVLVLWRLLGRLLVARLLVTCTCTITQALNTCDTTKRDM